MKSKRTRKPSRSRKLHLKAGFRFDEVNNVGNNAVVAPCIQCGAEDPTCPPIINEAQITHVSKILNTERDMRDDAAMLNATRDFDREMDIARHLATFDPDQLRFLYALPKSAICSEARINDVPNNAAQGVLRRMYPNPENNNPLLGNVQFFNMPAARRSYYRGELNRLNDEKKSFLRESIKILHDHGIFHNDLHGNNIVEGIDGNPRIIDFGKAIVQTDDMNLRMLLAQVMPKNPKDERRDKLKKERDDRDGSGSESGFKRIRA